MKFWGCNSGAVFVFEVVNQDGFISFILSGFHEFHVEYGSRATLKTVFEAKRLIHKLEVSWLAGFCISQNPHKGD